MNGGLLGLFFVCATVVGTALGLNNWSDLYPVFSLLSFLSLWTLMAVLLLVDRPSAKWLVSLLMINWVAYGLEFGLCLAGPNRWSSPTSDASDSNRLLFFNLLVGLFFLFQYWRTRGLRRASPQFGPSTELLSLLCRLCLVTSACSLPIALGILVAGVLKNPLITHIGLVTLLRHQLLSAGLVINCFLICSESYRYRWQHLSLTLRCGRWFLLPAVATGIAASWHQASPVWMVLPILFLRPIPGRQEIADSLTPFQATLLLRLPLAVTNMCLSLIPPERWPLWFREDRQRLHLREPLLEVQKAPGYFAALAQGLIQTHNIAPEELATQEQLADFCLAHPLSVSQLVLSQATLPAVDDLSNWRASDLNQVRKASKWTTVQNLLLLGKVAHYLKKH
jgi:hypothetical protein